MKILVIQNKAIGDVIACTVIPNNFKKIFPQSEVHFFCYDRAIGVLQNNPNIDKIISFNDAQLKNIFVLFSYLKKIRSENYDVVIDPYAKLQSRLITLFSRAKMKISFKHSIFGAIYTHTFSTLATPRYCDCTTIEDRAILLSPFVDDLSKLDYQVRIFLNEDEQAEAKRKLREANISTETPLAIIGAMGSSMTKTLPLMQMARLIDFIFQNYQLQLLLNYVPNQQKNIDELISYLHPDTKVFTEPLGNNIREFAAILSQANVIIANEGGATNLAKALRVPCFSIFAPLQHCISYGCYDSQPIHKSIQIEDVVPDFYKKYKREYIKKNIAELFKLMPSDFVIEQVDNYLKSLNFDKK